MPTLEPQLIFGDCSKGVISSVSHRLAPQNSVSHAVNFVFDEEYGNPKTRLGSTLLGSQLIGSNYTVTGLFQFIDSEAGANSHLLATANGITYSLTSSTWSASLTGDTVGLKTRFETFLDEVVRVNGTDTPKSWSGSGAWSTTGGPLDLSNMPNGSLICVYKDQVIIAGVSGDPDALYISSVPNAGATAISWTDGNRRIVVNPEDGSNITGLGEIGSLLIVFKRFAMYRWNNRATEADTVVDVGCSSHESICVGGQTMFFFNENGWWATRGDYPTRISRPVQVWIDGMDATYYDDVAGFCDGKYLFGSIGNVTLFDGRIFNNVVLRYSLDTHEWAVFSYANKFNIFARYVVSGAVTLVGGDTTSRILTLNSGSTDNGTDITYEIESQEQDFGSRGMIKELHGDIYGFASNPTATDYLVSLNGDDWISIGSTNKDVEMMTISETLLANFFKFRISGVCTGSRLTIKGLELPSISVTDYGESV